MRCLPALTVLLISCAAQAAGPQAAETASGADLFQQFCSSCHGTGAKGDGPVAPALRAAVPDLGHIAARNQGAFDAGRVRESIDGRAVLPAHGTREMPVWGYELEARTPQAAPGRATAQAMTDRLVEYLRSIQRP